MAKRAADVTTEQAVLCGEMVQYIQQDTAADIDIEKQGRLYRYKKIYFYLNAQAKQQQVSAPWPWLPYILG